MLHAKRVELSLSESNMHSISEGGNIAPKVFGDQQKKVKEIWWLYFSFFFFYFIFFPIFTK